MDAGAAPPCRRGCRRPRRAARRRAGGAGQRGVRAARAGKADRGRRPATASCCATLPPSAPSAAGASSICGRRRASAARRSGWRSLPPTLSPTRSRRWRRCWTLRPTMSTCRPSRATGRWPPPTLETISGRLGLVPIAMPGASLALSAACWTRLRRSLVATLEAFHAENPDLPGIGLERLRLQARAAVAGGRLSLHAAGAGALARARPRRRLGAARRPRGAAHAARRGALGRHPPAARRRRPLPPAARARHRRPSRASGGRCAAASAAARAHGTGRRDRARPLLPARHHSGDRVT